MTSKFAPIAPLLATDFYKVDHRRQYPDNTTGVLSNFTDRKSRIPEITKTVHFGLQAFLQSWLTDAWEPFFAASEDEVASLYEEFLLNTLGPNEVGSDHIRALHKLGYLPLHFRSLPEGSLVPLRVPKFTVENTHPDFFWLTNFIESVLSAEVWQPATTATLAYRFRQLLDEWAIKTTGSTAGVQWQGHDFSFRGMAGQHAAAASGAGHLLSFTGSDSMIAGLFVDQYYPGDNGLVLGSVAATEHSVATAYGPEDDLGYFKHLIDLYPSGIVSAVSDSYDLWATLTKTLPALKDEILARNGKLVIRPDSGDPVDILTGTIRGISDGPDSPRSEGEAWDALPQEKGVIELLWDVFGGTVNEQGYKVLDPHIGTIYGDSITYERALAIMERLEAKGFASTNVVFGVGSFSYQYVTRDTFGSAVKATWVEVDGKGREIFKDPITDDGTKKSAKGRLAIVKDESGDYALADQAEGAELEGTPQDQLTSVWKDGEFLRIESFADIRARLGVQE